MSRKAQGFTLVELIAGIAIIAISFIALISVFTAVVPRNIDIEGLTRATFLAEDKMEDVLVAPFAGITSESAAYFPPPFNKNLNAVEVHYVGAGDLDTPVAGPTDYKNVKVKVWGELIDTIEVVTLVTTYELH